MSEKYRYTVIAITAIGLCIAAAMYYYHARNIEQLKLNFQQHSHAKATDAAHSITDNMHILHEDMMIITRLLAAYDFGSYNSGIKRKDIDPKHDEAIREIYRSMYMLTGVSELYITPVGFDPDRNNPATGLPQAPIITYDSIIKTKPNKHNAEVLEEIEIHEYREMKRHVEWFAENHGAHTTGNTNAYPSLSSGEVITCDNSFMDSTAVDDSQRSGIVYSIPIYNKKGMLTGILSSVVLTRALRSWLPGDNYALRNKANNYTVLPANNHMLNEHLVSIREMKKDPGLIYSAVIPVDVEWTGWSIWTSVPNRDFWKSDAVRLHYSIVSAAGILTAILLLAAYVFSKIQFARKILLEEMVREKTIKLQREIESRKLTEKILVKAKEGMEILLRGRTAEVAEQEKILIEAVMEKELTEIRAIDRESFISAIFNTVIDAIISINDKGIIQSCNKSAVNIFGYKQKELIGHNISMLMPEPYASGHDAYISQYVSTKESAIIGMGRELVGKRKDGSTFPMELGVGGLSLDSGTMFVGIIKDITERKNIEQELVRTRDMAIQSSRVKSEFIANISHEIRTPMNGILGFLQLLNDSELSDEQKEYTDVITDSANGMMTIVNDIFDYSRIESGKINIEYSEFDIRNTIDSIVAFFEPRAKSKGLDIHHEIDVSIPDVVVGSPGRLRQVLVNLINNAIKFTSDGEISVKASMIEEGTNESVIMLEVSDTGPGISRQDQGKIFQSFVQVDGTSTRDHGGLGLGLAITKQLVEVMGGEVGVHSTHGEGSTFWFTLAFGLDSHEDMVDYSTAEVSGLSALIIDDEHTSRDLHRKVLGGLGVRCHSANNALIAMQEIHEAIQKGTPYDVIIIDIRNPRMDWIDIVKVIRENPIIEDVNIVVLCSSGQRGHGEVAQELDVAVYLSRPFKEEHLVEAITISMSRRKKGDKSLVTLHTLSEMQKHIAYKILVVEDNKLGHKNTKKAFSDIGYNPDFIDSGEEALNLIRKKFYDIVFMDIRLPGIDGIETTRLIKMSEKYKHTPIIALCSSMDEDSRQKAYEAGLDDVIGKPVIADILRVKISGWIEQKSGKVVTAG